MILTPSYRNRAFSMIELVIVVVIIGIIAAIAIPRMSRGVSGASDSALTSDLATLRKALDLYQAEHTGKYPALADFQDALTKYSDETGTTFAAAKDSTTGVIFGPYLRDIPKAPVGPSTVKGFNTVTGAAGTASFGWVYTASTGVIRINIDPADTSQKDDRGVLYINY